MNKQKTLVVFFLLAFAGFVSARECSFAAKSENSDGKMADVVVKEKDAFKIEKQKPPRKRRVSLTYEGRASYH